jgi:hypothetical protein
MFGAGIIFGLWGFGKWASVRDKSKFSYAWAECFDSMGWLYAGIIIAIQAAIRCFNATDPEEVVGYACWGGAVVCLAFLLNAMNERGQDDQWYPPISLRLLSILLAVGILAAGYRARLLPQQPEHHSSPAQQKSKASIGGDK